MTSRREFFFRAAGMTAALAAGRSAFAQDQTQSARDTARGPMAMSESVPPVRLPPKPDAKPLLTADERDALEHRIHCQCGCTLDVYTCRTTDFSCQVSPAMHRDVMALVEGGYSAQEIIDAFVNTFGERARMAPEKSNVFAWFTPGAAVIVGAGLVAVLLKRWKPERSGPAPVSPLGVDATPDELARLDAVLKGDDRP